MSRKAKTICCSLALLSTTTWSRPSLVFTTGTAFIASSSSKRSLFLSSSSFRSFPSPSSPSWAAVSNSLVTMSSSSSSAAAGSNSDTKSSSSRIANNIQVVRDTIQSLCQQHDTIDEQTIRLVAVSKTKPLEMILDAYENGNQRVFGENYVQELIDKVTTLPTKYSSKEGGEGMEWHFIGNLQSNKANSLVKTVYPTNHKLVIETVSSIKLANKLNTAVATCLEEQSKDTNEEETKTPTPIDIYVQVNTSGEDTKNGILATSDNREIIDLCHHIRTNCPHLHLKGLMTIGAPNDPSCFDTLVECRKQVCQELGMDNVQTLELSMGMSGDYEEAILKGSTNVRVGSTIFGERDYSAKK